MTSFASRPLSELSGGERQRAWIALALAQDTSTLLLDEPTTFFGVGHQLEIMELIMKLNREQGLTIVLVLHDLNQAARYAGRMLAMRTGRIVTDGPPREILFGGAPARGVRCARQRRCHRRAAPRRHR